MTTLLQTLLIRTLEQNYDPVLRQYIDTVLPAMESIFGSISALGGSEEVHFDRLTRMEDKDTDEKAKRWASSSDQSLLVHVLNALLIAWALLPFLDLDLELSDDEKRLLCLGLTLHDYNKYCQGEEKDSPKASQVSEILSLVDSMGKELNFDEFWSEWKDYIPEIGFLAQNTQGKCGTNLSSSNWPTFKIRARQLKSIRPLLAFGDVAVHMNNPSDIATKTGGNRLNDHLRSLGICRKLVYHRLRNTTGILTNAIHNATLHFSEQEEWQPLLFFAQGVVYLAPLDAEVPEKEALKASLWNGIEELLAEAMLGGEIGFKRDGKGVKVSPQTLELFSPAQLIRGLPNVIEAKVKNEKYPATPKRLASLDLEQGDLERLSLGADIRSDRLAELIGLAQKEFFSGSLIFTEWVLDWLKIQDFITPEQTQVQKGGVNYGWYRAAAEYVLLHLELDPNQFHELLEELANSLVEWAEDLELLVDTDNPTRDAFLSYLDRYLEVSGWDNSAHAFQQELERYTIAKTKASKQPICSLSSGEFVSEDQMDSVVLFKPQQYSNKNPLGGGQIKRGISKVWALEMLLRQDRWKGNAPAGKMEDRQPIFLYLYPAFLYAPQVIKVVSNLVKDLTRVNFWDVHKFWLENNLDIGKLRDYPWVEIEDDEGRFSERGYGKGKGQDLPFLGICYTTTRGKTLTDSWVEPAFLSLFIARSLGIKVIATPSQIPLYGSDSEFRESVKLDGPSNFWTILGFPDSLHLEEFKGGRIQKIDDWLERLLIVYSIHLDSKADAPDPRWRALPDTARQIMSDVLNIFYLAEVGCRKRKRDPTLPEVRRYWEYGKRWSNGDLVMTKKLALVKQLAEEYRQFYRVTKKGASSHAILLPLSKALDVILSVPHDLPIEDLILEGAGQLKDAVERQEYWTRPIWLDTSLDVPTRKIKEMTAIHQFMETCVKTLFEVQYEGDRALLQENRNRIKSGVEFAYLMLALEDEKEKNELDS